MRITPIIAPLVLALPLLALGCGPSTVHIASGDTDSCTDDSCADADRPDTGADADRPDTGPGTDVGPDAVCGDGVCTAPESTTDCASDCGSACGDGACNGAEDPTTCANDCAVCGDGVCHAGEVASGCTEDCPAVCGDGVCASDESAASCAADCPDVCGDGACTGAETAATCSGDCGDGCGDGVCRGDESAASCAADCPPICGDGHCAPSETGGLCVVDCGVVCGDGVCTEGTETSRTCPDDCGAVCGDGACNGAESTSSCADDCGSRCGDGTCNGSETTLSCPDDCGTACGDGSCNGSESTALCPDDCGTACGDGACNGSESSATCSDDCGATCGDGSCNGSETTVSCPDDCGATCGDGSCNGSESTALCPEDCGTACGDGTCNGSESSATCPGDCGSACGADACDIAGTCVDAGAPSTTDHCQVCLPTHTPSAWTSDPTSHVCDASATVWSGTSRALTTTPRGHVVALSCHNCYHNPGSGDTPSSSLSATLDHVHDALDAGADLIELDIAYVAGAIRVDHEDDGGTGGATLVDVLADTTLQRSDALLFIEIKEQSPSDAFITALLTALRDGGYATAGRPVVLRAFNSIRNNLILCRHHLATDPFDELRPFVMLSELYSQNQGGSLSGATALIDDAVADGFHMVEFEYRDRHLLDRLYVARDRGLGTNVYTFGSYTRFNGLREEIDAVTTDYDLDRARTQLQEDVTLIYLDMSTQTTGRTVRYHTGGVSTETVPVGGAGQPQIEPMGAGAPHFGGRLACDAASSQSLTFYDADNSVADGYLVSVGVEFDDLSLTSGETRAIVNKSDAGGFALELSRPAAGEAVLRFGVHVDGSYRYATYPAGLLNTSDHYFVLGGYDGNGGVWLWVNNSHDNVTNGANAVGGVTQNDSPVVLCADPQGATDRRFFFSGRISHLQLLDWHNH